MYFEGDVNDYVGKGMIGGKFVIYLFCNIFYDVYDSVIMGNICFYGVIGGKLFVVGCVGECFGVCNFGVIVVVEGIGDNGCEYMIGGIVVVFGLVGVNFGVGMIGGFVYFMDDGDDFDNCVNVELVDVMLIEDKVIFVEYLCGLIN